MRLNRYFFIAAMGLGLFACADDLDNNEGQNGNKGDGQLADVSIKLDFRGSQTRAAGDLPEGEYDDAGTQAESNVNTLRVIVTDEQGRVEYNQLYQGTTGDNKLPDGINGNTPGNYEGEGQIKFKIPTGLKTFYVYVNEEAATPAEATDPNTDNAKDLQTAVGNTFTVPTAKTQAAAYFATANKFHMSGLVKQEITTVAAGSANEVTVNVDRVVAKVQLRLAAGYPDSDADPKVTLKSLTAGIGNADLTFKPATTGDTEPNKVWGTYRFANNGANNVRQTPYYGEVPTVGKDNYANIIVRYNAATEEDNLLDKEDNAYPTHTYYCLENTHDTYTKGNTTFVQITAQMIPTATVKFAYKAASGAGDTATPESIEIEAGDEIDGNTEAATFYVITKVAKPAEEEEGTHLNSYIWESDLLELYSVVGFITEADKNITGFDESNPEHQIQAVRNALLRHHYEFTEAYEEGVGYFYKAVNDMTDTNGKFTGKAPVFRNDWYDLTINSIKLPGRPTSEFGGEEPLHPDTDVNMTVKIRKWNKVDHTVDLE